MGLCRQTGQRPFLPAEPHDGTTALPGRREGTVHLVGAAGGGLRRPRRASKLLGLRCGVRTSGPSATRHHQAGRWGAALQGRRPTVHQRRLQGEPFAQEEHLLVEDELAQQAAHQGAAVRRADAPRRLRRLCESSRGSGHGGCGEVQGSGGGGRGGPARTRRGSFAAAAAARSSLRRRAAGTPTAPRRAVTVKVQGAERRRGGGGMTCAKKSRPQRRTKSGRHRFSAAQSRPHWPTWCRSSSYLRSTFWGDRRALWAWRAHRGDDRGVRGRV